MSNETANAIVAKGKADLRVVLAGADVRTQRSRCQIYRQCPGERDGEKQHSRYCQVSDALPHAPGCREQIEQSEGRHYQVGLQHLDIEAYTYRDGTQQQPAQPSGLGSTQHCPGSQQQNQGQSTINRIIAVSHDANRAEGQRQGCQQASCHTKVASYQVIKQGHREHTCKCLRQVHAEKRKAEDLGA